MVKDKTLYERLGVDSNATESDIKKAYNKLSKIWHPDRNETNKKEAEKKFQEINQAKEILLDQEKRNIYDNIGMDIFKMPNQQEQEYSFNGNPFGDFGNIFGAGFPFNTGMPNMNVRQNQPENIVQNLDVTLEQIYKEESVSFTYKYKDNCIKCNGEGTKDGKQTMCPSCDGKGMKVQIMRMGPMIQQMMGQCHVCKGKGRIVDDNNKCNECTGKGYIYKEKTIQVPLKAGLSHGNKIQISGRGNNYKNFRTDLIIIINELPHPMFKRYQNDLFVTVDIKLYQALFGFDKIINHLDGRKLHISCSGKTDFNMVRKLSGEGMKNINSNNKGDLYIKFNITLPNLTSLPTETKLQLKSILQSFDKNEVQNEMNVVKNTDSIKTILSDCKLEHTKQIIKLMDNLNESNNNIPNNNVPEENHTQCAQQ